jgi:hypothetical protein
VQLLLVTELPAQFLRRLSSIAHFTKVCDIDP